MHKAHNPLIPAHQGERPSSRAMLGIQGRSLGVPVLWRWVPAFAGTSGQLDR
jgi:hypothetical protein